MLEIGGCGTVFAAEASLGRWPIQGPLPREVSRLEPSAKRRTALRLRDGKYPPARCVMRAPGWHNRKLRWKRIRRERMLEQCSKQCLSTPISDKVAL
jgi:hypothetical protein